MIIKFIIVAVPAICAALLTLFSKKASMAVFKKAEREDILKIKITALLISILAFALAVALF